MSDEPNNPADVAVPVQVVPPNHWRTRIRAISNWARKSSIELSGRDGRNRPLLEVVFGASQIEYRVEEAKHEVAEMAASKD
jgi:hypothetical protein